MILVGFMGAGKSSVGRAMAEQLGWTFEDLDDRIERREGRKVPEIFRDSGEAGFRRAEHTALKELMQELQAAPEKIVALGGGAFVQKKNAGLLEAGSHSHCIPGRGSGGVVAALPAAGRAGRSGAPLAGQPGTLRRALRGSDEGIT